MGAHMRGSFVMMVTSTGHIAYISRKKKVGKGWGFDQGVDPRGGCVCHNCEKKKGVSVWSNVVRMQITFSECRGTQVAGY